MSDIKSIFKIHFAEGGEKITATTGETLACYSKYHYDYNYEVIRETLEEIGSFERSVDFNTGLIDAND